MAEAKTKPTGASVKAYLDASGHSGDSCLVGFSCAAGLRLMP